jgi:hypothetical protein
MHRLIVERSPLSQNTGIGGRMGWRLASVIELKSVQAPSLTAPFVPAPVFTGVQSVGYWSASTVAVAPATNAWMVLFTLPSRA